MLARFRDPQVKDFAYEVYQNFRKTRFQPPENFYYINPSFTF